MSEYLLKISAKTKVLNFFRLLFKIKTLESFLINRLKPKISNLLYDKIVPPNYLYSKNSIRRVERNSISYELDLSDVVDHAIFFELTETSRTKLYSLLKKSMTVFDIGANMGDTALNFSKITGEKGVIYAFEPDNINFTRATKNIQLNSVTNILLQNIGLGNVNQTLKLYKVNSGNQGMNRILSDQINIPYSEIKVRKLDDFIDDNQINKIDLIKIDVEGYEMNVLNGGIRALKKLTPILFIEINDANLKLHGNSASSLVKFLNDLNYTVYHADSDIKLSEADNYSNCHYDIYAIAN